MSFQQELSKQTGLNASSLDRLVKQIAKSEETRGKGVKPNNDLVYNQQLNRALQLFGDIATVGTKAQKAAWKKAATKKQQKEVSSNYASFIEEVLTLPVSSSKTLGDLYKGALSNWKGTRGQLLTKEHHKAEETLQDITGETPRKFLEIQTEIYNPRTIGKNRSDPLTIDLKHISAEDLAVYRVEEEQTRRAKEIRNGDFTTEEEARNIVYNHLDTLEERVFGAPLGKIERAYRDGDINITTINVSELGQAQSRNEKRKIQSRTKSGGVSQISGEVVDSETYKLFKTLIGERDDYSYDSIALMVSGTTPEETIKMVLDYHTDSKTQVFNIAPENGTPGAYWQFLNELQDVTSNEEGYIRDVGRAMQSPQGQVSRNKMIQRWIHGDPTDRSFKNEKEIRSYLNKALNNLSLQYQEFVEKQARLDKKIVEGKTEKGYIDTVVGFDGELIRVQNNSLPNKRNGEVNVPLEILINPFSEHYKKGAGGLYQDVYGQEITGPGKGKGNHQDYARKRRKREEELRSQGLYEGYKAFQEIQPRLV